MNDVTAESVAAMLAAGDTAGLNRLQAELTASLFAAWGASVRPGALIADVPLCASDDNVTGAVVSIRRRYAPAHLPAGASHAPGPRRSAPEAR
jgi:hypothetical protein